MLRTIIDILLTVCVVLSLVLFFKYIIMMKDVKEACSNKAPIFKVLQSVQIKSGFYEGSIGLVSSYKNNYHDVECKTTYDVNVVLAKRTERFGSNIEVSFTPTAITSTFEESNLESL